MKNINSFTEDKIAIIKSVAREHAINRGANDTGIYIKITNNDIKEATGRTRIKKPIMNKIVKNFENVGMEAEILGNSINIYCPPLLEDKEEYSLKEIEERKLMMDELNIIESYKKG